MRSQTPGSKTCACLFLDQMDSRSLSTLLLVGDTSPSQRLRMGIHESLWGRINCHTN
ncbi:MAG: hypothetical protein U0931_40555 [Vulcanimicrobiota bacterium]